jgi:hypothetical protein
MTDQQKIGNKYSDFFIGMALTIILKGLEQLFFQKRLIGA